MRAKPPADGTHGQVVMWLMKRCLEHTSRDADTNRRDRVEKLKEYAD
ncbi:hypothetical protein ACIBUR_36985 [Streptomyces anulatus]